MEPYAHDKDEGVKKVIVAANSSGNHGLRARSSKTAGSPRQGKHRAPKSYSGTHNPNGSLINLSWPSSPGLGNQLSSGISPGNASPEKIPLGHYRTGSSFENSRPDMQLNSSKFLSDSNVAKFNATLFSSASNHASRGLDVEEAMDIDHQESNDEACVGEGNASVLPDANVSCQPRASEEKSLPEKYPLRGESDSSATSSAKPKVKH